MKYAFVEAWLVPNNGILICYHEATPLRKR